MAKAYVYNAQDLFDFMVHFFTKLEKAKVVTMQCLIVLYYVKK